MKLVLRIIPLLALLVLAGAVALRHSRPVAWSAAPVRIGEGSTLAPLEDSAATGDLLGLVRGPDGQPIAEAVVLFEAREPRWAYTDSGGRFRLERVPLGPRQLSVWAREHRAQDFAVEVPASELELILTDSLTELPILPDLETLGLDGQVVPSIAGRGLAGYEVLLLPANPISHFGEPVPRRTTVGADRSFHFDDLILGEYRVVVLPPWARGGGWPNLSAPQSRGLSHSRAANTSGVELVLATGEIRGTVTDLEGHFLEGALCLLSIDSLPDRVWPAVKTDSDGSFLLTDLPPEIYRLRIRAGAGSLSLPIEVPPGTTVEVDLPTIDPTAK